MVKPLIVSKPNYTIRRRFFDKSGLPMDWQDCGHGTFISKDIISAQFKLLSGRHRKTEIEFRMKGVLMDAECYPIKQNVIYYNDK
jgi:hypothetical protein